MFYTADEEIYALVKKFEDRTLPKADWTHAAHLTVGLFYCFKNPFGVAKNLMSDGIYWLNDAHGTPNTETSGYHETLTVFWIKMLFSFVERNKEEENLHILANEMLNFFSDTNLPLKYYSRELLFSKEARFAYVEPDLDTFTKSMNGLIFAV
ncbi:MAG TPA: hypothetical protein PKY59_19190 [Pyrinomonadaceae bacterium]|nr:hypothetical protein [Pyrinomonadaceae bacterium]